MNISAVVASFGSKEVLCLLGISALMIFFCTLLFRGVSMVNRSTAMTEEFRATNQHIIRGLTKDPIEAIYHVYHWIFEKCPCAGSVPMWMDNAYAIMMVWLRSEEARNLYIKEPQYVKGRYIHDGTSAKREWVECVIAPPGLQPVTSIIIDINRNLSLLYAQGGSTIRACPSTTLDYIVSIDGKDWSDYVDREVHSDPDYRLK